MKGLTPGATALSYIRDQFQRFNEAQSWEGIMPRRNYVLPRRFWCSGIAALTFAISTQGFAEDGPSRSAFVRALRPIPSALQGGHQGLPTAGASLPAAASPTYRINDSHAVRSPASKRAGVKNAGEQNLVRLPGCPVNAEPDTSPMIGFKVAFEFGSAQIKPESLETLRNLGKALNRNLTDQGRFEIQGHTDAVGTLAYNEQLSLLRAEAVKDFLIQEMSVSAERLVITGKAYCQPVDPQQPYAAENRRVVVLNQSG